jgi:hypothetical protein
VLTQEQLLRPKVPGAVSLLAFLTPLSGLLIGLLRATDLSASPRAPKRAHFFLGLLLWGSSSMSTSAARHLAMPVSLAMKSVKILPTMLIASLWLRKRFLLLDWCAALLSAVGMVLCLDASGGPLATDAAAVAAAAAAAAAATAAAAGSVGSGSSSAPCSTLDCRLGPWLGPAQMTLALLFDGGSANAQEAMIRQFASPPQELALFGYGCATLAALLHGVLWVSPGEEGLLVGLQHVSASPALALACALFTAASCAATWCSLELISGFGASSFMLLSALAKALVASISIATGTGTMPAVKLGGIALVFAAAALAALAKSTALQAGAEGEGEKAAGEGEEGSGLRIRAPELATTTTAAAAAAAVAVPAAFSSTSSGGAMAAHLAMTPRTARIELGGSSSAVASEGLATLRRRGVSAVLRVPEGRSGALGSGRVPAQQLQQQQQQGGGTPLRKTLSSALTLVSAAALGIERPQPAAEALSPLGLSGGSSAPASASASPVAEARGST